MNSSPVPTLARGVAKRVAREAGIDVSRVSKGRRNNNRKHWIDHSFTQRANAAGEWFIGFYRVPGNPKKPVFELMSLERTSDSRGLGLCVTTLDSRKCTADVSMGALLITQHALERIAQRLKTGDPSEYASMLVPAIRRLLCSEAPEEGAELFVPTSNGVLLGNMVDGEYILKTFVDDTKLRPEQQALKAHITATPAADVSP